MKCGGKMVLLGSKRKCWGGCGTDTWQKIFAEAKKTSYISVGSPGKEYASCFHFMEKLTCLLRVNDLVNVYMLYFLWDKRHHNQPFSCVCISTLGLQWTTDTLITVDEDWLDFIHHRPEGLDTLHTTVHFCTTTNVNWHAMSITTTSQKQQ